MKIALIAALFMSVVHAGLSETWVKNQYDFSLDRIFAHTSRPDTPKGFIVAAPSRHNPDYYYHWVRDAALVMNGLQETLSFEDFKTVAHDYIQLVAHHQNINKLTGQGEPKFNADGTSFTGPWGRPQNDGPALRVITLAQYALKLIERGEIEYVREYLYNPTLPALSVIKVDLEYTSHHHQEDDFDLWEEIRGTNFYSKMAQRKALLMGSELANKMGDSGAAAWYYTQAKKIDASLEGFWSHNRGHVLSTIYRTGGLEKPSRLDASTFLAVLHSGAENFSYGYQDHRILNTVTALVNKFKEIYPINNQHVGVGIGRYAEDVYFGGQPWFLLTAGLSEFYYELAAKLKSSQKLNVTAKNVSFFNDTLGLNLSLGLNKNRATVNKVISTLKQLGDDNLERIRIHSGGTLQLDEQFDRNTGYMTGAPKLTWSYASYLTAVNARRKLLK